MSDRSAGPTRLDVARCRPNVVPDFPRPDEWTPPSWEDVVRAHSARVYRLAYRLTGDPHEAEDLTQEVFVRVFRSLSSYTPGTFEGWLHRITTNLFLDTVRRKQRIRFDALAEDAPSASPAASRRRPRSTTTPISTVTWRPPSRPCRPTSAPPWCCVTSRACRTRRSQPRLGVKLGTVRSRIHRGRAALRAALDHRAPKPAGGRRLSAVAPAAAAS